MPGVGLVRVMDNAQIEAARAAESVAALPKQDKYSNLVDRIGAHIEKCWQQARMAKDSEQREMLRDLRQRKGEYDPEKLTDIRSEGGSEVYMMLTSVKCRAAESWIRDTILPQSGERPFAVDHTPVPEIPPFVAQQIEQIVQMEQQEAIAMGYYPRPEEVRRRIGEYRDRLLTRVKEEAKRQAELMEQEIDDKLVEGMFYEALDECISDFVTLPAAIIKGPVARKGKRLVWDMDPQTGRPKARVDDEIQPFFCRVSPLDLYPAPGAKRLGDGFLIEHVRFRPAALHAMIGVPGYNEARIRAALDEYRDGYLLTDINDQERRDVEGQHNHYVADEKPISGLEFTDYVSGTMLLEWGIEPERVPDPAAEYHIKALKIGRFVVRVVVNEDPLERVGYYMESFERINDSIWGLGVPRLMRDLQGICNAAARSIVNNMALASGPMMEVETDRLAEGESVSTVRPWRVIQSKASRTSTPGPAIRFFQPDPIANILQSVFDYFARLADDYTGIPAYSYGSTTNAGGAANTASGMSMMLGNAARGIKRAVGRLDRLITGAVEGCHTWLMLFGEDHHLTGDIKIRARGATWLAAREQQQVRKAEFLRATTNQFDFQIMGPDGRARLLREMIRDFDVPPDEVIPNKDEVLRRAREAMEREMMMNAGPQPGVGTPENPRARAIDGSPAGGLNLIQQQTQ